jgi:GH43 family beta-xylosidase
MVSAAGQAGFYTNPVHEGSFPDPFVLKFCGEYVAYCTGAPDSGGVFGVMRSTDLVNWSFTGAAMDPLPDGPPFYWAPEVTYDNGAFYLYYSCGNETLMELRVAVSERPDGGFVDTGRRLSREDFAIDAHIFTDDDGSRYLFYATDFLEHTHIGTGTVVDKMRDLMTPEGRPSVVTRAKYDWQVYDPQRKERGGVRWHTVEGPFILKRKGVYYEMFSGGNWQNPSYGVSFATTRDLEAGGEWEQFADGTNVLPILRTIEGKVIGPGHNSVIRGPDNRELYCVYHRWVGDVRAMAIDRLDIAGERIFIEGPTTEPAPAPLRPAIEGFGDAWSWGPGWEFENRSAATSGEAQARLRVPPEFLAELSFRQAGNDLAISLASAGRTVFDLRIRQTADGAAITAAGRSTDLPKKYRTDAVHQLRIEVNDRSIDVRLDGHVFRFGGQLNADPDTLLLGGGPAELRGFALTAGFEDLFEGRGDVGAWSPEGRAATSVEDGEMVVRSRGKCRLVRGDFHSELVLAVNMRLAEAGSPGSFAGFALIDRSDVELASLRIGPNSVAVICRGRPITDLRSETDVCRQYRVVKSGGNWAFFLEGTLLHSEADDGTPVRVALLCSEGAAAFEAVRLTLPRFS